MMKSKYILGLMVIVAMALAMAPVAMAKSYVLLVEQTPVEGGIINPGIGVHNFTPGEMVTLTATPRAGYQFVRWMGDVSAADVSTTTVTLDAPKMLVAVFERVEYGVLSQTEEPLEDEGIGGAGGGTGRLVAQYPRIGGGGGVSSATSPVVYDSSSSNIVPPDDDEEDTDGELPVPTPEPGTIAIMILGAAILRRTRESNC